MEGLVSIIIPTYNRYELLNHSIKSVLASTYSNIEIIVINDCSTDTRYYSGDLEKYEKTTVIHLPINQREKYNVNSAQGLTKNYGINAARGEWIAFLDDDDFFYPIKIELQIKYMKQTGGLFSSTNMNLINHSSITLENLDYNIIRQYFQKGTVPKILTKQTIEKDNYINNSTVIIHRSIIDKTGMFKAVKYEDWEYWKRALEYTECLYIDLTLLNYTFTINNKSNTKFYIAN